MRDIPLFTTKNGIATLILKKIPFTKEAYVHIRDSCTCDEFLKECIDLCRMAGAEYVYATGHDDLSANLLHCSVLRYSINKSRLPNTDAVSLPIALEQKEWWRKLYNEKMANVPTAAPLSLGDAESLIKEGKAFCVYRGCLALGIGVAYADCIHAVASVVPGAGRDVVAALADVLEAPVVSLSVASTNEKALNLYRSLGFVETAIEANWYEIYKC